MVDDLIVLFWQQVVLATERADDEVRLDPQHAHHAVGHQARAGDQKAPVVLLVTGAYHHFVRALVDGDHFAVVADFATGGFELTAHGSSDLGVVHDAARRHKDTTQADDVRLALAQFGGRQPVTLDAVGFGTVPQRAHALHFQIVRGHQQLATLVVTDAVLVAEGLGGLVAFQAETRFQAARRVIDAGVDHAAVVAGLVLGRAGLFLQQEDFRVRVNLGQLHGRGHAHNAATDDDEVVHSH
ncbi:hypothetical protein D9M71_517170 [compost metagenome]